MNKFIMQYGRIGVLIFTTLIASCSKDNRTMVVEEKPEVRLHVSQFHASPDIAEGLVKKAALGRGTGAIQQIATMPFDDNHVLETTLIAESQTVPKLNASKRGRQR